jgi:transketolase
LIRLRYGPLSLFRRVLAAPVPAPQKAELFSVLCRINVLYMVKRAGSGHLGTSFSCQDIVSWIYLNELKGEDDLFFSSKGHDVPAFYAALSGLGRLSFDLIHALRRLGGLPGHPEVELSSQLEANTGSLGMGISKAKGMLLAKRAQGKPARAFVLTGDGELDEGQIWESLPSAVNRGMANLTVIVDHNKIQSDTWVHRVSDLGNLEAKFRAFGWHVVRASGNDARALSAAFAQMSEVSDRPKVFIADTVKGKGVSFMEAFGAEDKFYAFHSGAPTDEQYEAGLAELTAEADRLFQKAGVAPVALEAVELTVPSSSPVSRHKLVEAHGRALVREATHNAKVVALDADLMKDCGLAEFAERYPNRLIECGIAEQDMVSQAGGLALKGMLPVVHSFSSFLSARANEQIYANASEGTKVVYVGTLAGLLPATPGHSHQSVRDASSLGAVPNLVVIAPATEPEAEAALDWALNKTRASTYLRLSSIPCVLPFAVDARPVLVEGRGTLLHEGKAALLVAYGPVMTAQAYLAAQRLHDEGIGVGVLNLPWLNRLDGAWLAEIVKGIGWLFPIDDHYLLGGQGEMLLASLVEQGWPSGLRAKRLGLSGFPSCGQNDEVLRHHGLDAPGIANSVRNHLSAGAVISADAAHAP